MENWSRKDKCFHCMPKCYRYIWYGLKDFFTTLCVKDEFACCGWEINLLDRCLFRLVPLKCGSKRICRFMTWIMIFQAAFCTWTEYECSKMKIAAVRQLDYATYIALEIALWGQIPIMYIIRAACRQFKKDVGDGCWLIWVRIFIGFNIFCLGMVSFVTMFYIPDNIDVTIYDNWLQVRAKLHNEEEWPLWVSQKQRSLECCGLIDPQDWLEGESKRMPQSCCPFNFNRTECNKGFEWPRGCLWPLLNAYENCRPKMMYHSYVGIITLIIFYVLFRYLMKRHRHGWNEPMTWREALWPLLKVDKTFEKFYKKPKYPPLKKRLTERQAIKARDNQIQEWMRQLEEEGKDIAELN